MTSKEKVYELLTKQTSYISGEEIAKSLGISRNAIWKAIESLRRDGYVIDAVTKRGYRLIGQRDRLDETEIRSSLGNVNLEFYEDIPSTNVRAKQLAILGAESNTVVIARQQSNGNGRKDHSFYSPEGGIYLSIILRPDAEKNWNLSDSSDVMRRTVEAVQIAIKRTAGIDTTAENNDIYLNDKKVAGILTEAGTEYESDYVQWVVIGIGLNVYEPSGGYPEEIEERAGALLRENAGESRVMNRLVVELVNQILS